MNKENVIYTNNKILFPFKNEGNPVTFDTCEPWGHRAKWNKPVTESQMTTRFHSCYCFSCQFESDSFAASWTTATRLLSLCDFPGENTGVGCHCRLSIVAQVYLIETKEPLACLGTLLGTRRNFKARWGRTQLKSKITYKLSIFNMDWGNAYIFVRNVFSEKFVPELVFFLWV